MDTDAVRWVVSRFRKSAVKLGSSLVFSQRIIADAPWQSQAREAYIQQLELLRLSSLRSAEILRLMGITADQNASQWEALRQGFGRIRQFFISVWNQLRSMLGWTWHQAVDAMKGLRLPSVPRFIGGALIGGGAFIFSPVLSVKGVQKIYPGRILKTDQLNGLYIYANPNIEDGSISISG